MDRGPLLLQRATRLALAVTGGSFLTLIAMAMGWTDAWSQDLAMLAVIVAMGLTLLSILLNTGLIAASLIRGFRHGFGPLRPTIVYLVFAALAYAILVALLILS